MVLFNRFYQVDIDIEKVRLKPGYRFSSTEEMSLPLRWIALLADTLACDLSGTTGIHDAAGAIKMLLAGASTVQVCSALYQEGLPVLQNMLDDMEAWMEKHGFETVEDFRGRLSFDRGEDSELWERLQYIKAMVGVE